ncbi:MAG: hypothetical protein ACHQHN_04020 [Sphingobacteriales bacterium]
MKRKFILIILLLAGVSLTYTACKKSSNKPTVDAKTVSSQIALNLAQTLYGGLGGFDISNGLSATASINRKQLMAKRQQMILKLNGGKQINDIGSDISCGLTADTTLNYSVTDNGVSESIAGTLGFTFLCTNNVFSGFNIHDNLTITAKNTTLSGTYKLIENLTAQAQDPTNVNSSITLGGTFSMSDNISYVNPKSTTSEAYSYNFSTPLLIDSSGNIDSGACSFTTSGSNASGTWNYSGTVTFLGNNNVKIVINGASYTVNLQTGTVS